MASTTSPTNRLTAWRMNVTKNMQQWQQQAYQYEHGLIDEDDAETVRSVIQRYIDGLKTIASDEMFRISLLDNEQQQEDTENWVQRMTPAKELKRQLMMVEKSLTPLPLAPTQPSSRSSVISERYAPSTGSHPAYANGEVPRQ
uniref:PH domain-containing protein n=1 Tax=Panagrellus redivivus TaxID=6233 RepID=A0A7E4W4S6_PANRE